MKNYTLGQFSVFFRDEITAAKQKSENEKNLRVIAMNDTRYANNANEKDLKAYIKSIIGTGTAKEKQNGNSRSAARALLGKGIANGRKR